MDYSGRDHQTADQCCVRLFVVSQSPVVAGLSVRPIGYSPALSVTYSAAAAVFAACGAI